MIRYFLVLAALLVVPSGSYLAWLQTLPTEQEVLDGHREDLAALLAQIRRLLATLPPPGSVTARALPTSPDPAPVCEAGTGRGNLQTVSSWMIEDPGKHAATAFYGRFGPTALDGLLTYVLARTERPHEFGQDRIWGFSDRIRQGLGARYLLVNRYLREQTPKGPETTGTEGFLLDLHEGRVVGGFRYPDWFHRHPEPAPKNHFLTETLGGPISPQFRPAQNVRIGDVTLVTGVLVFYLAAMGILAVVSVPVAFALRKQHRRLDELKTLGLYPDVLRCPRCGRLTPNLKQFRLLKIAIFIFIAGAGRGETVTACPACMRRHIGWRAAVNLIPANLLMIAFGPALLFQFLRTFQPGHSPDAVEQAPPPCAWDLIGH